MSELTELEAQNIQTSTAMKGVGILVLLVMLAIVVLFAIRASTSEPCAQTCGDAGVKATVPLLYCSCQEVP